MHSSTSPFYIINKDLSSLSLAQYIVSPGGKGISSIMCVSLAIVDEENILNKNGSDFYNIYSYDSRISSSFRD